MTEYVAKRNPKRCPSHPGALIADLLKDLGLPVAHLAQALGISRQRLTAIITGKSPVTAEVAVRLGKSFGDGAEVWLRMQTAYDLWQATRKVELGKVVSLRPMKRQSRVTKAILEMSADMHHGGMFSDAEYGKIVGRLLGQGSDRPKYSRPVRRLR